MHVHGFNVDVVSIAGASDATTAAGRQMTIEAVTQERLSDIQQAAVLRGAVRTRIRTLLDASSFCVNLLVTPVERLFHVV